MEQESPTIPVEITHEHTPGAHVSMTRRGSLTELSLILEPVGAESTASLLRRQADLLAQYDAQTLRQAIFGDVGRSDAGMADLARMCGPVDWPVTWIAGGSCAEAPLAGTIVRAVAGATVERIHLDGRPVGSVVTNQYARYCHIANIRPNRTDRPRPEQTRDMFDQMLAALAAAGMDMSHVVRTWLCMEDILDWYDDFNNVRRGVFTEHGVYDRMLPASTVIGGRNAAGAAIIADVLAIQPLDAPVSIGAVRSPLQCPAEDYGSSFSRAVEVNFPDCRYLYVSGTASIDADGATLHMGDTAAQIDRTFEVVGALLASRGMTWRDVTRGIAYFRNAVDAPLYHQYCREHGLTDLPVIVAESTVCRDDLLFEIQVDGITRQPNVAHFLS